MVTWVKHQTPGAPLSGQSTIKSQQIHPPEVFSHLTASLMDDDGRIKWLHFFYRRITEAQIDKCRASAVQATWKQSHLNICLILFMMITDVPLKRCTGKAKSVRVLIMWLLKQQWMLPVPVMSDSFRDDGARGTPKRKLSIVLSVCRANSNLGSVL